MFTNNKKIRMRAAKVVWEIEEFIYWDGSVDAQCFYAFLRGQNRYLRDSQSNTKLEKIAVNLVGKAVAMTCKNPFKIFSITRKAVGDDEIMGAELLGYLDEMLKDLV